MKESVSRFGMLNPFRMVALFIFVSVFFCGCGTPLAYKLDPITAERVNEVNAEVCVENANISIKVLASGYGSGGGLIGAIIDSGVNSHRKNEAEELIVPLREKTKDISFRDNLKNALEPMLKELTWPQVMDIRTKSKSVPITESDVNGRSFLEIYSNYELSTGAEVLDISTGFAIYLKGSTEAAVIGSTHYTSKRIGKLEENQEAIALWAENDAAAYKEALNLGIEETVKMLRLALPYAGSKSPIRSLDRMASLKVRIAHGRGDYGIKQPGIKMTGWIVEDGEDRVIFQSEQGSFYSFPKADILERLVP
jgi:hypothetical protein